MAEKRIAKKEADKVNAPEMQLDYEEKASCVNIIHLNALLSIFFRKEKVMNIVETLSCPFTLLRKFLENS